MLTDKFGQIKTNQPRPIRAVIKQILLTLMEMSLSSINDSHSCNFIKICVRSNIFMYEPLLNLNMQAPTHLTEIRPSHKEHFISFKEGSKNKTYSPEIHYKAAYKRIQQII